MWFFISNNYYPASRLLLSLFRGANLNFQSIDMLGDRASGHDDAARGRFMNHQVPDEVQLVLNIPT